MIPQETVNLILDTAQISDVVGDFVTLKRRGANFIACCPFHNEKTPSFYVSPSKGIYKCFGCGKAGTAVGFVMEHEHYSYSEALKYLAKRYNIEVVEKEESAEDIAARQRNESLLLVTEFAHKFFVDQLKSGEGKTLGYSYYRNRGLEDATIEKYGLGWAPSGRTTLLDAARAAGYKEEYLLAAGLCIQREDGRLMDKFYERVMFPIHSVSGRVIAFSGRTLRSDKEVAKYVNSPETEIYVKSRALMGIYFAKGEISRQDNCILVEGNLDVIAMHQLGLTNVVASCGTSLTVEQIRLIHKFTENITIMYDGDSAGIHAAIRGIGMVLKEGMNVKVVLLPDGDDPDSYSRKHTKEEVEDFIAKNSRDFITFKSDLLLEEAEGDPLKKANLINDIADTIADIPDAVKRSVYVETVAQKFGIESGILFDRIAATRRGALEEERRAAERESRRRAASASSDPGPTMDDVPMESGQETQPDQVAVAGNRILDPSESELLTFMLKYGTDVLEFETDSEMYTEEGTTVADFIAGSLEAEQIQFENSLYRKVYDAYLCAFDEGKSQDEILRSLLNSEDREISTVAARLSMDKYEITVQGFAASLTTTSSWLVKYVPRAMMFYYLNRCRWQQDKATRAMAEASSEDQLELMKDILSLRRQEKVLKENLGL